MAKFFESGFRDSALSRNPEIEAIPKDDLLDSLATATRDCGRGKKYEKGKRSFELLGKLDAERLKQLPHFASLCDVLEAKL